MIEYHRWKSPYQAMVKWLPISKIMKNLELLLDIENQESPPNFVRRPPNYMGIIDIRRIHYSIRVFSYLPEREDISGSSSLSSVIHIITQHFKTDKETRVFNLKTCKLLENAII